MGDIDKFNREEKHEEQQLLPMELIVNILVCLPLKPATRFKCVSKRWLSEINSEYFTKLHQQRHPLNDLALIGNSSIFTFNFDTHVVGELLRPPEFDTLTKFNLVGSSKGSLCFLVNTPKIFSISLYDPETRAYRVLPDLEKFWHGSRPVFKVGFGYDGKNNEYKILKVSKDYDGSYIYRSTNNSWEQVKKECEFGRDSPDPRNFMVMSNNALHWKSSKSEIYAFDLGTEDFYEVQLPSEILNSHCFDMADLNGRLHITNCSYNVPNQYVRDFEIWVMKEYRVQESWTKLLCYSSSEFSLFGLSTHLSIHNGQLRPSVYAYSRDEQEVLIGLESHPKNFFRCSLQTREVSRVDALRDLKDEAATEGFYVQPL